MGVPSVNSQRRKITHGLPDRLPRSSCLFVFVPRFLLFSGNVQPKMFFRGEGRKKGRKEGRKEGGREGVEGRREGGREGEGVRKNSP